VKHFRSLSLLLVTLCLSNLLQVRAAEAPPLRALLITGGCCHDYLKQKDILKRGLEARLNVVVDQIHVEVPPGTDATKPPLPVFSNPDYAKGYHVVIHDECAANIDDLAAIRNVLAPHRQGLPGVNLHCAVHSYRVGKPGDKAEAGSERAAWFEFLGLQSSSHGPQEPLVLRFEAQDHPVAKGLAGWTTGREELYNNIQLFPTATPIARATQTTKRRDGTTRDDEAVVVWANLFHGTRVFTTSVGHNNSTVEDARYLDLVARGLLWACGKLDDQGQAAPGYTRQPQP